MVHSLIKRTRNSSYGEILTIRNSIIFYIDAKEVFMEARPKIQKNF
jgi:hypothetical protein